MRVLAVWEAPLGFPEIDDDDLTEEERVLYGIDGISPEPLGPLLDPMDVFVQEDSGREDGEPLPSPCPFLLETKDGIAVHRHPDAFVLEDERLWSIWAEWKSGVPRDLARADYRERSAWWMSAWSIMCGAWNRQRDKRYQEFADEHGEGKDGGPE